MIDKEAYVASKMYQFLVGSKKLVPGSKGLSSKPEFKKKARLFVRFKLHKESRFFSPAHQV